MEKFKLSLGVMLSLIMLQSCNKQGLMQEEQDGQQNKAHPASIFLSSNSLIIYPNVATLKKEIAFEISSASEISNVWADSPTGIISEVSLSEDKKAGTVSIASNGAFSDGAAVVINATNSGGIAKASISLTPARLLVDKTSYSVKSSGATLSIGFDTNLDISVSSQQEWVQVEKGGSSLDVTIARNNLFENRDAEIIISEPEGIMNEKILIIQEAAIDYCKKEREALIALYNATGGRNWTLMTTSLAGKTVSTEYWCTDMPLDQWYGVELGGDGHVTYVRLGGMNLSGTLPEEIGDLVYCQELVVSDNSLTGELPSRIGDMQALKSFQASGNSLSGDISLSTLSKIASKLKLVSLQGNEFTGGFPQWIGDVPEQCNFWLQDNCLSGVVPQKVQSHPRWNAPSMDGSGKTIGEVNMEQKSGYVLTLE